ncbi:Triacylglycerol lipase [Handroanthus impetiginosus]|uniref:Triacylglycerol lipase n=1 Tax=Handroanthus impetiginosus TaxID=429701 RepID=A0A2G9GRW0_9LAMI|nr:Triacylglycerol lipase [Handroanthus impetiginosus]
MELRAVALLILFLLSASVDSAQDLIAVSNLRRKSPTAGLCACVIEPSGFLCSEHTTQTKDGYLLGLQRVSSPSVRVRQRGSPVLLIHGLFMAGDAWFMDSPNQSLGFILANHGFDVWVGNVRGTFWSHGHMSLSEKDKDFWDWSWQELAFYDLGEMIR